MFAVISIPNFQLQAVLRHEPDLRAAAVALVREDSARSPVWQVTAAAQRHGVAPGITSTQAKARCNHIAFRLRSPRQEEAARQVLLETAYAFAASIESTAPGVCTMDLRGLPLLKTPDRAALLEWAGRIVSALEAFHLSAQVGVAATPSLAFQATHGPERVQFVQDATEFRNRLEIAHLCDSAELLEILEKWGIRTAAALIALGRNAIAERLGPEGLALFDAAKADRVRPLDLTLPKEVYEEYFEFENAVETLEPLLFILRRLLDQLAARVGQGYLVIEALNLALRLDSGEFHRRTLRIPAATRNVEVLFRILHNYLETVRTESPVVAVSLEARPCAAETRQFQLFETAVRDPNRFYETIGRLHALLGPDRVGRAVPADTHRPDSFQMEAVKLEGEKGARESQGVFRELEVEAKRPGERPLREATFRGLPLRRFRPPLRAEVKLAEGQPVSIRSSRFRGAVARSQGPYRLSGEWWENLWAREEWDVQTAEGDVLRLVRERQEWLIEGAYD